MFDLGSCTSAIAPRLLLAPLGPGPLHVVVATKAAHQFTKAFVYLAHRPRPQAAICTPIVRGLGLLVRRLWPKRSRLKPFRPPAARFAGVGSSIQTSGSRAAILFMIPLNLVSAPASALEAPPCASGSGLLRPGRFLSLHALVLRLVRRPEARSRVVAGAGRGDTGRER